MSPKSSHSLALLVDDRVFGFGSIPLLGLLTPQFVGGARIRRTVDHEDVG